MIIYEVEMTNQADQDIENICKYIALDSIDNSISFIKKFQYKIKNTLSIFPEKHRKYKNGNVWCYGNYLIFFEILKKEKTVNVIRIINSAQYLQYKNLNII